VEGSARIEGERVEPTVDGNQLLFTVEDGLDAQETKTLVLALAVGPELRRVIDRYGRRLRTDVVWA